MKNGQAEVAEIRYSLAVAAGCTVLSWLVPVPERLAIVWWLPPGERIVRVVGHRSLPACRYG
jgi:hypothetical protein